MFDDFYSEYKDLENFMSAQAIMVMEKHFKDCESDISSREASPLLGKKLKHSEKACKSTYA